MSITSNINLNIADVLLLKITKHLVYIRENSALYYIIEECAMIIVGLFLPP